MQILPKLALLATLAFPALSLAAYEVDLFGKVVDAAGKGVAQVEIALKGTAYKATTNASGAWVLQKTATALLGPTLSAARSLSEGQGAYSVSGRLVGDTRQLAQGVYVQKQAGSVVRNQALAKAAGEKDSLIVTYGTSEVGRLEQANLLQGKLADMMLLTVSPTLTQGTGNSPLASIYRLLGQTVLVNYVYDASLWRPSVLTVGSTKTTITAPAQKQFAVTLGAKEDAAVNLMLLRAQTIVFSEFADKTYGDAPFQVSATASSGLPVEISSSTTSVCSVSNGMVSLLAAGACKLNAIQVGNDEYGLVQEAKTFTVAPIILTATAHGKVYDGSTAAILTFVGNLGSDVVMIGGRFETTNAGSNVKVSSLVLTGAQAGNYTLGTVTFLTADIEKKPLSANADKVYDGTVAATLKLTGIVGTDVVTGSGTFASADVGSGITVNALKLAGAQAGNYTLGTVTELTADITKKTLTVAAKSGTSLTKVFDGTTVAATVLVKDTHYELSGVVGAEGVDVTVTGTAYNSANVSEANQVVATFSTILTGADASHYRIEAGTFGIPATIEKATLAYTSVNPGSLLSANSPVSYAFSTNADAGVTIASATSDVCEYASGALTLKTAGLCTITATPIRAENFVNGAQAQSFGIDHVYDGRDERLYKIVKIGTQVWMAENLAWLPAIDYAYVSDTNKPRYYVYGYSGSNLYQAQNKYPMYAAYGALYNYTAALTACPEGWKLPSNGEWTTLVDFAGGEAVAGKALKSASDWSAIQGIDSHGFAALPGGVFDGSSSFLNSYTHGVWWSATTNGSYAYAYIATSGGDDFSDYSMSHRNYGHSVRCLMK